MHARFPGAIDSAILDPTILRLSRLRPSCGSFRLVAAAAAATEATSLRRFAQDLLTAACFCKSAPIPRLESGLDGFSHQRPKLFALGRRDTGLLPILALEL